MSGAASSIALLVALLLLLGGGGYYWLQARTVAPAPAAVAPAPEETPVPAPIPPAQATPAPPSPAAATAPAQKRGGIRYPDGSVMPALNGVTEEVTLQWGKTPFTRIVGVITDERGQQWYRHEDGTMSTVWMGEMNGVPQAQGAVAQPTSAVSQPPPVRGGGK